MSNETPVAIRDRAARRVRRLTALAVGGATALTAAFAGIAAGSTHTKSHARTALSPTPATTARTVTAPVPSLTPSGSSATPQSQSQQQTQVTPSAQAPVAVSGGS